MHVLIVGFGATGQRLATRLVAQGHQVTGMSRRAADYPDVLTLRQSVHEADFSALAPVDWVYVLLTPDERTEQAYRAIFTDSLAPLYQALNHHPVQRMVFISSTSVYGKGQGEVLDENSPIQPDTPTAKVLAEAEQQWHVYWQDRLVIIRPSGIYADNRLRLINWVNQQKSVLDKQWTNRIHIDDLAGFLAHLTTVVQPESLYVVTDQQPVFQHEVLGYIAQQLKRPAPSVVAATVSGKRLGNQRMRQSGYALIYPDYRAGYDGILSKLQLI